MGTDACGRTHKSPKPQQPAYSTKQNVAAVVCNRREPKTTCSTVTNYSLGHTATPLSKMSQMITLCLGMVILAFIIPSQVHSQTTTNITSATTMGNNASTASNASVVSPVTTSTNTTTPHGHANSLYSSSLLLLSVASISLFTVYC